MTLAYTYDGAALTHNVAPSGISIPQRAEGGEASSGGIPVEDPTGTLAIVGWRPFTVEDDACSQPRLFTGWTFDRGIGRDLERGLFVGADPSLADVTIYDLGALFMFRLISGADGNRPEETWDARLAWILGSDYLTGLIADTGYVASRASVIMDAADYRKGYPQAVLDDLQGRLTGEVFNYYAFWDTTGTAVGLFFDDENATIGDCPLTISNVDADIDSSTCFAPDLVAKLTRSPDQTYSEVMVTYGHGSASVFRSRPSTAANYIRRGTSIDRPYTGKLATATIQAEGFLSMHANERDRLTCSIQVPAESVGLVRAGQRISVKFSHMPGYETFGWTRIAMCDPKPTNNLADFYDVALELLGTRDVTPGGGGGACDPTGRTLELVQSTTTWTDNLDGVTAVLPAPPTCGNIVVAVLSCRAGGLPDGAITGFTKIGPLDLDASPALSVFYRTAEAGDSATVTVVGTGKERDNFWVGEIGGTTGLNGYGTAIDVAAGTVTASMTPTAGGGYLLLAASVFFLNGDVGSHTSAPSGSATEVWDASSGGWCPDTNVNWRIIANASGAYSGGAAMNGGAAGYPWGVGPDPLGTTILLAFTAASSDTQIPTGPLPPVGSVPATTAPTVTDDADAGYVVGARWIDTATGREWVLVDATAGAAVWVLTTTGDLRTPDYLVGTAQAGLSAEIVVGTTPGGELGGTWASPTVVATHSGSAHHAHALNNLAAVTDPAVTDDSGDGYAIGSRWINTATDEEWVATDVTVGAAVWVSTTAGGGGGGAYSDLTDVDVTGIGDGDQMIWDAGTSTWLPAAPGGVSEITDIPTAETDTALVLHPDGAGGVAWGTDATGGGGASPYPLDTAPGSPHAKDDEFDDTTGMSGPNNGLDAQWTAPVTSAADQGITVTYPSTGWMAFEPTTAGSSSTGKRTFGLRQTAPAGSFTVMAKIVDGAAATDEGRTGIFIATTGDKAYVLGSLISYSRLANYDDVGTYSESNDWSGYGGTDVYAAPAWPGFIWLKLVYDEGADTVTAWYSASGLIWRLLTTQTGVTAQPDRIGLVIWANGADIRADHFLYCNWFRVTEP